MTGREYNNQFSEEELKTEVWKKHPVFEFYEGSNLGRVRSLDHYVLYKRWKNNKIKEIKIKGRLLSPIFDCRYKSFSFRPSVSGNANTHIFLHRFILECFVGFCPEGMECCHNDGNSINDRLENLRWDTPKNNQADRIKHGTLLLGENHPNAKLTYEKVNKIRMFYCNYNYTEEELAKKFKISRRTSRSVVKNETWKNNDYVPPDRKEERTKKEQAILAMYKTGKYTQKYISKVFYMSPANVCLIIKKYRLSNEKSI